MAQVARVCVTGPECTGKTTLAARLAAHFGTVWVPEYAREYALEAGRPLTYDDVEPIARGQMRNEERCAAEASGLLVCDTDLISTSVYSRYYYGQAPEWVVEEAFRRRADLYLLLDIDVPFIPDPARDAEEDRPRHYELFVSAMEAFGARAVVIGGGWEERFARALEAVERLASSE